MTMHSERLEHEAEQVRWQVSQTLDELRSRISPGQVIDQVVDYAKEGSAREFVHNLGRQVKENPLSLTLVAAGLAWLMLADRAARADGTRTSYRADNGGERLSDKISKAGDELGERAGESLAVLGAAAHDTKARANAALDRATGTLEEAAGSAKDTVESTYRRTAEGIEHAAESVQGTVTSAYRSVARKTGDLAGKVSGSATSAVRNTTSVGRRAFDFCREQPLVLAGLGLAVGAAIGAVLPRTAVEEDLLGAHEAKDEARAKEDPPRPTTSAASEAGDNAATAPEALPEADGKESGTRPARPVITDGESG